MIELEKTDHDLWSDADGLHVIVHQDWTTYEGLRPGWFVRDEDGESGSWPTLAGALLVAADRWGEVTLAPANRLRSEIETGRADEVGQSLLEYLTTYGTAGIDVQALAQRVFERIEED